LVSRANVISQKGPIGGVKFSRTLPLARRYIWFKWSKKAIELSYLEE